MENKMGCRICSKEISEDENCLRMRPVELVQASKPAIYACTDCVEKLGGESATQEYLMKNFVANVKKS